MSPMATYDQAVQSSMANYRDIMSRYDARTQGALDRVGTIGQNEQQDLARRYTQMGASAVGQSVDRGFGVPIGYGGNRFAGNSTIGNSLQHGINQQYDTASRQLGTDITNRQLAPYLQTTGDQLGYMGQYGQQQNQLGFNYAQLAQQNSQFQQQQAQTQYDQSFAHYPGGQAGYEMNRRMGQGSYGGQYGVMPGPRSY